MISPARPPPSSAKSTLRSKLAVCPVRSFGSAARPANAGGAAWVPCSATMAWNTAERLVSRGSPSSSTTFSNGVSWCANASSVASLTWPRNARKGWPASTRARSTTVLTKNPATRSSSARSRPATTVPTAMSSWPDQRCSSTWQAAASTMNSVASVPRASSRSRPVTPAGTANPTVAPAEVRTAGRGRSAGSSSGVTPSSAAVQYATRRVSASPVSRSRCQTA